MCDESDRVESRAAVTNRTFTHFPSIPQRWCQLVVIPNNRADTRPGYLQDTKLSVFYAHFALSVRISAQLTACHGRDISVGTVNRIRTGCPRDLCSIPDRATEISFIHTVRTGAAPKHLLEAYIQTLLRNHLCFCERASSGWYRKILTSHTAWRLRCLWTPIERIYVL